MKQVNYNAIYSIAVPLSKQLHWLKINPDDGIIELYLDHHMLSTYRMCPSRFFLEMVQGINPKGSFWFLEFGSLFHSLIEYYYLNFRKENFKLDTWLAYARQLWALGEFDRYKDLPNYKDLGGFVGLAGLLTQYQLRFHHENERLRVIGTELYFGKGKEVPLLAEPIDERIPFRLYLAGKIDILIDIGTHIGPMDHKTHSDFRGKNPNLGYEVQDGMTGYVFANQHLLKRFNLELGSRQTNMILMNHAQVKPPANGKTFQDRFSRLPLRKTEWDLEQFRLRQISTARDIFNMLIDKYLHGLEPQYNTGVCSNWWHRECQYHVVHRQTGAEAQLYTIKNDFVVKPIWDPENRDNDKLKQEKQQLKSTDGAAVQTTPA